MAPDWLIAWVVVPGMAISAVASVWSAAFSHLSSREVTRLGSRLRREEEAFRIAHSPRVMAAIDLWTAFCAFERAVDSLLWVRKATVNASPEIAADVERERLEKGGRAAQAWEAVAVARDRAEVLLPPDVFTPFQQLFVAQDRMAKLQLAADRADARGQPGDALYENMIKNLDTANDLRPAVLKALRVLIDRPAEGGANR